MELGRRTLTSLSELQAKATAAEDEEELDEGEEAIDALKWEGLVLASLDLSMRASAGRTSPLAEDLQTTRAKSFVDLVCTSPTLGLDAAIAPRKLVWASQAGLGLNYFGEQGAGMSWSARLFQLVSKVLVVEERIPLLVIDIRPPSAFLFSSSSGWRWTFRALSSVATQERNL